MHNVNNDYTYTLRRFQQNQKNKNKNDWNAFVLGSLDVIKPARPSLPTLARASERVKLWQGIENRGFNRKQNPFSRKYFK